STIRGRNSGIWSNVSLSTSGAVTIEDPLVTSTLPLPDASHADIAIQAAVHNQSTKPVAGTLRARFGDVTVEAQVTIDASGTKTVTLDPSMYAALRISDPKLWWPVGYGEPNLYNVELSFIVDGKVSDTTSFQSGI